MAIVINGVARPSAVETVWLSGGGINSTWYLKATMNHATKRCTIELHDSLHNDRDPIHPKCISDFQLVERRSDRTVTHVNIDNWNDPITYTVDNPRKVFDYGQFKYPGIPFEQDGVSPYPR